LLVARRLAGSSSSRLQTNHLFCPDRQQPPCRSCCMQTCTLLSGTV
jgi:hypothetical protein